MKKKIFVLLLVLCTINWMYLSPDKIKWGNAFNEFPIVKYKVNPEMIGFNTGDALSIIDNIRKASDFWSFQSGDAHFQFSYSGTTTNTPLSYQDVNCTEEAKVNLRNKDNLVFANNGVDNDCTAQACTYLWTCNGTNEILHFDTEINTTDFEWDTGTNHKKSFNLATVLANQFGKIIGLDHCSAGLTEDLCSIEAISRGTSNPDNNSLVYKFVEPEVIRNTLSLDDKAGLQALYGKITPQEVTMKLEMNSFYPLADSICNPNPCVIPEEDNSN